LFITKLKNKYLRVANILHLQVPEMLIIAAETALFVKIARSSKCPDKKYSEITKLNNFCEKNTFNYNISF